MVAERGPPRRHRQSLDARSGRAMCPSHADRQDHHRSRQEAAFRHSSTPGSILVHVDDVASGHLAGVASRQDRRALHSRRARRPVFADAARYRRPVGRRAARVRLPWQAVIPFAYAAEALANVTGREPFATRDGVHMAKYGCFRLDQGRAELGYCSRLYTEGIGDAVRWFREVGYLDS